MSGSHLSREELDAIPPKWLEVIVDYLVGLRNDTVDFSRPQLRPSVAVVYPFFVLIYSVLVVFGTAANLAVIWTVARHGLHRDPTFSYIVNLALSDIVKCVVVLPVSLTILLVQNWIFGSFLCYFLPMLQDIPLHVSMLSFLLIAVDRYRLVRDPTKPRMPSFVCALGTWLLAVCIVLPYPIYVTYLDLGMYIQQQFEGVGICAVNLVDDMQEYMRGLFLIMYILPLAVMAYLYVRISRELPLQEGPIAVMMYEARTRECRARCQEYGANNYVNELGYRPSRDVRDNFDLYEAELDVRKEKRTQKYLISMVTVFAICLCPLMVLRVAKLALVETYENSGHFDITFMLFVWIAFIPTCTTPCLFAAWRLSRAAKERLRGYFRFSNRQLRRSNEPPARPQQNAEQKIEDPSQPPKGPSNVAFIRHSSSSVAGTAIADFQPELMSS